MKRWCDQHGVVHAVGWVQSPLIIHDEVQTDWRTLCHIIPVVMVVGSEIETTAHYTTEPTTCLRCVVKEDDAREERKENAHGI
jgi:hypothetical protein